MGWNSTTVFYKSLSKCADVITLRAHISILKSRFKFESEICDLLNPKQIKRDFSIIKLLSLVTTFYHFQSELCKCLWHALSADGKPALLHYPPDSASVPSPIRNTEACGFDSAYHVSWSSACAELALQGLNGARSLWHDMSWAFACALCLVCAELGGVRGKSGWLLQVASPWSH